MPFQVGSIATHDDGQHTGSAKRDTALGVAGLSAGGDLLVPGDALYITRSGGNQVLLYERTANELAAFLTRTGANTFAGFIRESAADQQIQTASMKNIASGIAGLDASAKVPVANLPAGLNTANLLAAIAPTMANWGTNPDTPAQIAAELNNTLTTAGVSNAPAPTLKYDLGSSKRVVVSSYAVITAITGIMTLDVSDDDATYYQMLFAAFNTTVGQYTAVVTARYLRFSFASSRTHSKLRCTAYNI